MTDDLVAILLRTAGAGSVAILVVIALRLPLRRLFGCGVGYAAWLAVPLFLLASAVPAPAMPVLAPGVGSLASFAIDALPPRVSASIVDCRVAIVLAWACGAMVASWRQLRLQQDFVRSLGPLTLDGDVARALRSTVGPALIGLWRPTTVVPADFERRYSDVERRLISRTNGRMHGAAIRSPTSSAPSCSACGGSTR